MWVFLNDSFLSIVADATSEAEPPELLVRARKPDDIERVFPDAVVREGEGWDYLYRATIAREVVAQTIADRLRGIDYRNFKDSVDEPDRATMLDEIWHVTRTWQEA